MFIRVGNRLRHCLSYQQQVAMKDVSTAHQCCLLEGVKTARQVEVKARVQNRIMSQGSVSLLDDTEATRQKKSKVLTFRIVVSCDEERVCRRHQRRLRRPQRADMRRRG